MKLHVMLDTNILISAIAYSGEVTKTLIKLKNLRHEMFVSEYIDHEFRDVILANTKVKSKQILLLYELLHFPVMTSSPTILCKLRDKKDEQVLSDAIYSHMDILLTGDKDFYDSKQDLVKVMTINDIKKEYLDND